MEDIRHKLRVLTRIADALDGRGVTWAVGASAMLYLRGLTDSFHDIDLMTAEEDADAAAETLSAMGERLVSEPSTQYRSRRFDQFRVEGVDIDLIAGFTVLDGDTPHCFPLNRVDALDHAALDGQAIPLQSLETWRACYALMGRPDRVRLIDNYLAGEDGEV